jgi:hypothetical protein
MTQPATKVPSKASVTAAPVTAPKTKVSVTAPATTPKNKVGAPPAPPATVARKK